LNTDFRVSVDFFSHHKARKLKKRIGGDGLLSLLQLWAYAAKNRPDGDLSGMSIEDIELASNWDGDEGLFVSSSIEVGFIEIDDCGDYVLHDWLENNPWAAGVVGRSDSSRLSRMARTLPGEWSELTKSGVKGVSKVEYEKLKNSNDRSTIVKRIINDRSTIVNDDPSPAPAPAPVPAPVPVPTPKVKKENIVGQGCPTSPVTDKNPDTEKPKKPDPVPYAEIVGALNEVCGCQFKPDTQATKRHIKARWNEGWRIPDFRAVIESRHAEWSGNPEMCQFLRPETLFGSKFESYLQFSRNGPVNGTEPGSTAPKNQDEIVRKIREARAERERAEVAGNAA